MNPLLTMMGKVAGGNGRSAILLQALGAYSRGESPESFLKSLAQNDPRFQGIDFSNLEKTAQDLCQAKGVDQQKLTEQVKTEVQGLM